jgi:uncharacterized protein (TIGR00369 family)
MRRGKEMTIIHHPVMTIADVQAFLERDFHQAFGPGKPFSVETIGDGFATLRFTPDDSHMRPGGTVSGPTQFALADVAAFVAIISHIGPVALAVTANMNINFLMKPAPAPILGRAHLLRLGKRNAVCEVSVTDLSGQMLLAHATGTYSIPG